jgi:signal transduction histidine kinase/CheY-like chemotaxis protein/HPt (histidine-containing phosphotransfer) domain-containing protein
MQRLDGAQSKLPANARGGLLPAHVAAAAAAAAAPVAYKAVNSALALASTERSDAEADRTVATLRRAALALALLIATSLPAAQLFFAGQSLRLTLHAEADQLAAELSHRAARSPERWAYEINGLGNLMVGVVARGTVQAVQLTDSQGRVVATGGEWAKQGVMRTAQDVVETGAVVGRVELQASTAALWRGAVEVALGALLLATAVWWLVARVAIRSVEAAITHLRVVRAEAEAANTAKGAFLAAMSHEIRTPMNGVMGMAELLEHSRLDDEQSQTVRTIRESASSLLRIIDDILDFSKIEAGRLDLEEAPLLLTPLVEGVCDALNSVASARGVQLSVVLEPGVPERVVGDAVRLRQILNNLVGNAIKFSGGRPGITGQVTLRVRLAGIEANETNSGTSNSTGLVFSVTDNGIGIDEATLAKLFTPFTQAEVSTTRRFGGTGLGLAICRRLAQLMGGSVGVQSRLGQGATFTVQLPLPATAEQPTPLPHDLQGLHCVLVAGADLPLGDLQAWLSGAQAVVHRADNLAAASALARGLVDADAGADRARGLRPGPVVLVRQADEQDSQHDDQQDSQQVRQPDSDPAADASDPLDLRHLLVGRGRQGPARVLSPTEATLELLRQGAFLRAVAMVAGRASPEVLAATPDLLLGERAVAPSIEQARQQGQLILVAEDDAINRAVILRQLALLGLAAEVAEDGAQALRMWHQGQAQATAEAMAAGRAGGVGGASGAARPGRYALLLSDLHMPELDGYGLALAIREAEHHRAPNAAIARIPILALTANALKGEALRAREAGMDDYLTKPVPLKLLQAALKQWLPSTAQAAHTNTVGNIEGATAATATTHTATATQHAVLAAAATAQAKASAAAQKTPQAAAAPAVAPAVPHALPQAAPAAKSHAAQSPTPVTTAPDLLNLQQLYQLVGDDDETVRELLGDFVAAAGQHVGELQGALRAGDNVNASRVAHKLKSASQSVGALALARVCADIEARRDLAGAVSSQRLGDTLAQVYAATHAALAVQLQGMALK